MVDKPTAKRARDEGGDTQGDRPAKRVINIDDFNNMITVLVGHEEQQFILYQDVVCAKSKFFKAACSTKWREGQEKVVRLPECPETTCNEDSDPRQQRLETSQLVNLHLLGETLDDIQLRNRTITMLFQSMRNQSLIPSPSHLRQIWESTPPRSQLRKMLVHAVISKLKSEAFVNKVTEYPVEFVQEIAVALIAKSSVVTWEKASERLPEFQEVEETG